MFYASSFDDRKFSPTHFIKASEFCKSVPIKILNNGQLEDGNESGDARRGLATRHLTKELELYKSDQR